MLIFLLIFICICDAIMIIDEIVFIIDSSFIMIVITVTTTRSPSHVSITFPHFMWNIPGSLHGLVNVLFQLQQFFSSKTTFYTPEILCWWIVEYMPWFPARSQCAQMFVTILLASWDVLLQLSHMPSNWKHLSILGSVSFLASFHKESCSQVLSLVLYLWYIMSVELHLPINSLLPSFPWEYSLSSSLVFNFLSLQLHFVAAWREPWDASWSYFHQKSLNSLDVKSLPLSIIRLVISFLNTFSTSCLNTLNVPYASHFLFIRITHIYLENSLMMTSIYICVTRYGWWCYWTAVKCLPVVSPVV